MSGSKNGKKPKVRCAVYTRKSTDEGLEQEFNSLDAQRDAAESFIASQKHEGWTLLPTRYDDGGFSGGNAERPALQLLMDDVQAGKVDCVVVYKVDRLSRSLLDFAKLMGTFEEHNVSFVSVTQQFNTNHSMGRLTLNILLSFAQFEREIIGERIRDKLAAQSRKGKWTGGHPILGYDVDRRGPSPKLAVNKSEAAQVRQIFDLYLQLESLLLVAQELNERGWVTKRWKTKAGRRRGGSTYDKMNVHMLLTNPLYIGKVKHKGNVYDGEHAPIIDATLFHQVGQRLKENGHRVSKRARWKYESLLQGLLYCRGCHRAMTHTYTDSKKKRRYRYYTCTGVLKLGRESCPSRSLPAIEIEKAIVEQIRSISKDAKVRQAVVDETQTALRDELEKCRTDRDATERELRWLEEELRETVRDGRSDKDTTTLVADLQERIRQEQQRLATLSNRLMDLEGAQIKADHVLNLLDDFDNVWAKLSPREQADLLKMVVQRVEFDARDSSFEIVFEDAGIKSLSREMSNVTS